MAIRVNALRLNGETWAGLATAWESPMTVVAAWLWFTRGRLQTLYCQASATRVDTF